jgi:hypothetical protein
MRTHSESAPQSKVALTPSHRKSLRNILGATAPGLTISAKQLVAIRELCAQMRPIGDREHALNALRVALVEIANEARIPYGLYRSELLTTLIGVFADEFFARPSAARTPRSIESIRAQSDGKNDLAVTRIHPRPRINCSPTL